uniref:RanBD1 domain-containing protein n=1 Tax=Trichuris muris TaxID=70415 RepID=A0A5S6Q8N5_TRIMR
MKTDLGEVRMKTDLGEVLVQITCILYVCDRKSSTWSEKGYSTLRINEKLNGVEKTTRIVMCLQGRSPYASAIWRISLQMLIPMGRAILRHII